jgi:hypothetical protein
MGDPTDRREEGPDGATDERRLDLPAVPGERRVEVQVGDLFGIDVRPSRSFVWLGRRREGDELVLPLDRPPKVLDGPASVRTKEIAGAELSYVGNPAVTLPLALYNTARHLWRRSRERRK